MYSFILHPGYSSPFPFLLSSHSSPLSIPPLFLFMLFDFNGCEATEDAGVLPVRKGHLEGGLTGISAYSPVSLTTDSQPLLQFAHWMARPEDSTHHTAHTRLLPRLYLDQRGLNKSKSVVNI